MNIFKLKELKSCNIQFLTNSTPKWSSGARLEIKGYPFKLSNRYYHSFDLAQKGLKKRLKKIAADFDLNC